MIVKGASLLMQPRVSSLAGRLFSCSTWLPRISSRARVEKSAELLGVPRCGEQLALPVLKRTTLSARGMHFPFVAAKMFTQDALVRSLST